MVCYVEPQILIADHSKNVPDDINKTFAFSLAISKSSWWLLVSNKGKCLYSEWEAQQDNRNNAV